MYSSCVFFYHSQTSIEVR